MHSNLAMANEENLIKNSASFLPVIFTNWPEEQVFFVKSNRKETASHKWLFYGHAMHELCCLHCTGGEPRKCVPVIVERHSPALSFFNSHCVKGSMEIKVKKICSLVITLN